MSIYTAGDNNIHTGNLSLTEVPMYGSSRLGMTKPTTDGTAAGIDVHSSLLPVGESYNDGMANYTMYHTTFVRGTKLFELSNHLGNVLVTISDKKIAVGNAFSTYTFDHFAPDVITANDYYPGGSLEPGRSYTATGSTGYRYGFNGKEKSDEISGSGVDYDYGARIYDVRIVRFLSVDPLQKKFPFYTPYQFAGNTFIQAIDMDGLEPKGYSSFAIFSHPGNQWLATSDEQRIKGAMEGKLYEMQVTDAVGDKYTVLRQVTEKFDFNTRRMYDHSEFYYLNTNINDDKSSMRLQDGGGKTKGYLTKFETRERTDTRVGDESGKMLETWVFKGVLIGVTGFAAAGEGSLFSVNNIFSRVGAAKAIVGGGADFLAQKWNNKDKPTNWISVGSNALFANPFTAAFGGSVMQRGDDGAYHVGSSEDIATGTIFGGLGNLLGSKGGLSWQPRSYAPFKDLLIRGSIKLIPGTWGSFGGYVSGDAADKGLTSTSSNDSSSTNTNTDASQKNP